MSDARRVLILDDEPMVGMLIESVARIDGAQARLTTEPAGFLQALQDWQPSHVVLDLTLPGTSGEEVLRQMAPLASTARVVLTSGVEAARLAAAEALARDLGLTVAGVVAKPFLPAQLRAMLG